jgi:hypothetical protein
MSDPMIDESIPAPDVDPMIDADWDGPLLPAARRAFRADHGPTWFKRASVSYKRLPIAGLSFQDPFLKPWDRQDGEARNAYEYFQHYRDQGPKRTLNITSERYEQDHGRQVRVQHFCGRTMAITSPSIRVWSAKYSWTVRARSWDEYQEQLKKENEEKRRVSHVKSMNERHARAGKLMVDVVRKRLEKITDDQILLLDPRILPNMLKTGALVERTARGEPGEISEVRPPRPVDAIITKVVDPMIDEDTLSTIANALNALFEDK